MPAIRSKISLIAIATVGALGSAATAGAETPIAVAHGRTVSSSPEPAGSARPSSSPSAKVTLRPGRHEVRVRIPVAPSTEATVKPLKTVTVSPRVTCGGFNGHIEWGGIGSEADPAYIDVWGKLWSTCSSTTYLYLSYHNLGSSYNSQIGKAGANSTVGINWSTDSHWASYSSIAIDTCTTHGGWTCGAPVHV